MDYDDKNIQIIKYKDLVFKYHKGKKLFVDEHKHFALLKLGVSEYNLENFLKETKERVFNLGKINKGLNFMKALFYEYNSKITRNWVFSNGFIFDSYSFEESWEDYEKYVLIVAPRLDKFKIVDGNIELKVDVEVDY